MRQLCKDLDNATAAADLQRKLIGQMKRDAEDAYNALAAEASAPIPFLLPGR
jgi:hypothetical protein